MGAFAIKKKTKLNLFVLWLSWVFVTILMLSLVELGGQLLFTVVQGLFIAVTSLVAEHGLWGSWASVLVAHQP